MINITKNDLQPFKTGPSKLLTAALKSSKL